MSLGRVVGYLFGGRVMEARARLLPHSRTTLKLSQYIKLIQSERTVARRQ